MNDKGNQMLIDRESAINNTDTQMVALLGDTHESEIATYWGYTIFTFSYEVS